MNAFMYVYQRLCLKTKKAYHLYTWQSGLLFILIIQGLPSSMTPIFYAAIIGSGFLQLFFNTGEGKSQ
jgi:hypothetical protein